MQCPALHQLGDIAQHLMCSAKAFSVLLAHSALVAVHSLMHADPIQVITVLQVVPTMRVSFVLLVSSALEELQSLSLVWLRLGATVHQGQLDLKEYHAHVCTLGPQRFAVLEGIQIKQFVKYLPLWHSNRTLLNPRCACGWTTGGVSKSKS